MSTTQNSNAEYLTEAKNVADFAHEVEGAGEWMKKRDLVGKGPFNIIAGNSRVVPKYQGKAGETINEIVFTVQFLGGSAETNDLAGCTVNTSMEADASRSRVLAALEKHGPHGPYWMECVTREGKNPYYRLTVKDPAQIDALADDDDEPLPFDEPVKAAPRTAAKTAATRKR